jgi:hypothetical protein
MSQIAVITVKAVADAPISRHGETEVSPKPAPSAINSSEADAATNAPAKIAAQDTADTADSVVREVLPT